MTIDAQLTLDLSRLVHNLIAISDRYVAIGGPETQPTDDLAAQVAQLNLELAEVVALARTVAGIIKFHVNTDGVCHICNNTLNDGHDETCAYLLLNRWIANYLARNAPTPVRSKP